MNKELIVKYINNIKDEDIYFFLNKNSIMLNNEEYDFLKNIIKDSINKDAYYKLLDIFNKYKIFIKE